MTFVGLENIFHFPRDFSTWNRSGKFENTLAKNVCAGKGFQKVLKALDLRWVLCKNIDILRDTMCSSTAVVEEVEVHFFFVTAK